MTPKPKLSPAALSAMRTAIGRTGGQASARKRTQAAAGKASWSREVRRKRAENLLKNLQNLPRN